MTITESLARHTDSLMAIPGVVGVGEGRVDGKPAIQIMVVELTTDLRRRLPTRLSGHKVQIVETGVIRAEPETRTEQR